jgi:DNA-binding CsgD family transcriptional regulator
VAEATPAIRTFPGRSCALPEACVARSCDKHHRTPFGMKKNAADDSAEPLEGFPNKLPDRSLPDGTTTTRGPSQSGCRDVPPLPKPTRGEWSMANPSPRIVERDSDPKLAGVEILVRQLVSDIIEEDRLAATAEVSKTDQVILDVEVDGVRCLLLRVPESQTALSPRELEIARMVAKGYPNKAIASVLEISSWTVASHLRRVFSKLGVSSRAAMVARLLEDGSLADLARGAPPQPPVLQPRPARRSFPAGSAP